MSEKANGWIVAWKPKNEEWHDRHDVTPFWNEGNAHHAAAEYAAMGWDARVRPFRYVGVSIDVPPPERTP